MARIISIAAVKKDQLIKHNVRDQTPKQYEQNVYNLSCIIILEDFSEVRKLINRDKSGVAGKA